MWNLMNKLNYKQNRDRLIDGQQMTALGRGCWGAVWGVERLSKKNKNHGHTIK